MNKLGKDELFSIAIMLDLPDLLAFCKSDERINQLICKKEYIWRTKLNKEFPDWKSFNLDKTLEESYKFLYQLKVVQKFLKEKANKGYSLTELYNLQSLDLSNNQLTEIPDLNLPNLQQLWLDDNRLTEIPEKLKKQQGLIIIQ